MWRFCKKGLFRSLVICAEMALVAVILVIVVLGAVFWTIRDQPVSVNFAKPYLEAALISETGRYAVVEDIMVYWPEFDGPLYLKLKNASVFDENNRAVVEVEQASLGLSKRYLFLGIIRPEELIVAAPSLMVVRKEDGSVDFGMAGGQGEAQIDQEGRQEDLITTILGFLSEREGRSVSSPLSKLERFEIRNARLVWQDHVLRGAWTIETFNSVFSRADEGIQADMMMQLPNQKEGDGKLAASFILDAARKDISFAARIESFSPAYLAQQSKRLSWLKDQNATLYFEAEGTLNSALNPTRFKARLESPEGAMKVDALSEAPVGYEDFLLAFSYSDTEEGRRLRLEEAALTFVKEGGYKEHRLTFLGEADALFLDAGLEGSLNLRVDRTDQETVGAFWPKALEEENAKLWIVDKMSGGFFEDVSASLDFIAIPTETGWDFQTSEEMAYFSVDAMDVVYKDSLLPLKDAKGSGWFDNNQEKLVIEVEKGQVGQLTVDKAHLQFVEVMAVGRGIADLNINLSGPLGGVLEYIERDPINFKPDFNKDESAGDASLWVNVRFPTVKDIRDEDVEVYVKGTLNEARLPALVGPHDISGGPFEIKVLDNEFTANGSGFLGGRPLTASYAAFLESEGKPYKAKADFSLEADEMFRKDLGIDLSSFLIGPTSVVGTYKEFRDDRTEVVLDVDATQSDFFIAPLQYRKEPGKAGEARLKAHLLNGDLQRIENLNARAPSFSLRDGTLSFLLRDDETILHSGSSPAVTVGVSEGSFSFEVQPSGVTDLTIEAQVLDLRAFTSRKDVDIPIDAQRVLTASEGSFSQPSAEEQIPMRISARAPKLFTYDERFVTRGKIYVDVDEQSRVNQLRFDSIAGDGEIYVRYQPDVQGMRNFRLEAGDAGATLKAFGFYDSIVSGTLAINATPMSRYNPRDLKGKALLQNFTVRDAPVLARLLSALSLPGMISLLEGEGLFFERLESDFEWHYKSGGSLLRLQDGRTSGNSLGLTFDGVFDNAQGTIDVSGTIVPISEINNFIGSIPLIGEFLTGGTGSLFAATYTMKGPGDEPEIFVNPLSVLTPGIIRRILFEN